MRLAVEFMNGFFKEPDWQYYRWSGVYMTSHLLIAAHESIDEWRFRMMRPKEDAPALAFGRAAHVLLTEPRLFEECFVVGGPVNPRTGKTYGQETKKYQEWAVEQKKQPITPENFELMQRMATSARRHKAAAKLLSEGEAEQVTRQTYADLPCQIRLDWLAPQWIADYKTTSDVFSFKIAIEQYGYLTQAAFYQAVTEIVTGEKLPYYLIATEKSEEATTVVWQLNQSALDQRRKENEQKLAEIRSEFLAINERRPDLSVIEQSVEEFSFYMSGASNG